MCAGDRGDSQTASVQLHVSGETKKKKPEESLPPTEHVVGNCKTKCATRKCPCKLHKLPARITATLEESVIMIVQRLTKTPNMIVLT